MPVWGNKATWVSGIHVQLYPAAQDLAGLVGVGRGQSGLAETFAEPNESDSLSHPLPSSSAQRQIYPEGFHAGD